jgi:glycosyltransferase involved in cell wall biosynthesis
MISVIISAYNNDKYIEEAIESILKQSYSNFELIIINDGSTDNTSKIIHKLANLDNRIIVIDIDNIGISKARNKGLELAKGEYIAIMDSDDVALPNRLEKQLNFLIKNNLDFCGSNIKTFGKTKYQIWKYPISEIDIKYLMLLDTTFAHPSVLIKSDLLKKYKYNTQYQAAEDYEIWVRLINDGFMCSNVNEVLLNYRIHEKQTVTVKSNYKDDNFNKSNSLYIDNFELELPFQKEYIKKLMNRNTMLVKKDIKNLFILESFIVKKCTDKKIIKNYFLNFYKKHTYLKKEIFIHIFFTRNIFNIKIMETFIILFFSKDSLIYRILKNIYTWIK